MKRILFILLVAISSISIECKKSPTGPSDTPQLWKMVSQPDGQIAEIVMTPFTYSGTFSETDKSAGWWMTWNGGKMRLPLSGTISHTSQGDHWYFTITVMQGSISVLAQGDGYSNGNFPNATGAGGTVQGTSTWPPDMSGKQVVLPVSGTWIAARE